MIDRRVDQLEKIGQRPPGVRRKAVADHRCGRLGRTDEIRQSSVEIVALQCGRGDKDRPGNGKFGRHRFPASEQRADLCDHLDGGLIAVADAVDQRANEPQRRLGTFHVARDPKQVGCGAARQRAGCARDRDPIGRGQQRRFGDRLVRQHPRVGGAPAALQAHRARVEVIGNAYEAAGHDSPPIPCPGQEQPQRKRARLEPVVSPNRRCRQGDGLLRDEVDAAVGDLLHDPPALVGIERRAEDLPPFSKAGQLAEKGRRNDHLVEAADDLVSRARLTEPPGRHVRQ